MSATFAELERRLRQYGQEHLLAGWDGLTVDVRCERLAALGALDFGELSHLYARRDESRPLPPRERIAALPIEPSDAATAADRMLGEEALARGEVAVLLVAGGQGTRLGFDRPKGMYPVGPVSGKSLFEIHADKVFALGRRYGRVPPLLVMTSPVTHAPTEAFFADHGYFGLPRGAVRFFQQGTMPVLDLATGRVLLDAPGRPLTSPNGHGGVLPALAESGLLNELARAGVRHVFYFQVDNPLVRIAEPAFLGRHITVRSEVSSKVVLKERPEEKVGVFVLIDGRCSMIEYCDMPDAMAGARDASGELLFRAGNPAIHIFDLDFLSRVARGPRLALHGLKKKVPHRDDDGREVAPGAANALKFESFVFDSFPLAERWLAVEADRREEFAPLKNGSGNDSPAVVRKALVNLAASWLEQAGVAVPRNSGALLEVSPRFAADVAEFTARVSPAYIVPERAYWE